MQKHLLRSVSLIALIASGSAQAQQAPAQPPASAAAAPATGYANRQMPSFNAQMVQQSGGSMAPVTDSTPAQSESFWDKMRFWNRPSAPVAPPASASRMMPSGNSQELGSMPPMGTPPAVQAAPTSPIIMAPATPVMQPAQPPMAPAPATNMASAPPVMESSAFPQLSSVPQAAPATPPAAYTAQMESLRAEGAAAAQPLTPLPPAAPLPATMAPPPAPMHPPAMPMAQERVVSAPPAAPMPPQSAPMMAQPPAPTPGMAMMPPPPPMGMAMQPPAPPMEAPMAQARADVMPQMDSAPPLYFPKEDVPPRSPMTAMSLPSNPPIPGGPGPSPLTQSRESTSAPSMLPEPELQQAPLASASTPSSMPVREVQAKESGGVLEKLQFWKKPAPTPQSERYVPVGNQQPMMPDGLQPMTAPTGNIAVTDAPMPRTNNVAPLTPIAGAQPSPSQEVSDGALMSQMGMEPSSDAAIQLRAPGGPAMESAGIPESRYATRRARNHRDSY